VGYSSTAAASYTLEKLGELFRGEARANGIEQWDSSNILPDGGFWEIGRENDDGSITGKTWKPARGKPGFIVPSGSFKINADGTVARFPHTNKAMRVAAEDFMADQMERIHGQPGYRRASRSSPKVGDAFDVVMLNLPAQPDGQMPTNRYWVLAIEDNLDIVMSSIPPGRAQVQAEHFRLTPEEFSEWIHYGRAKFAKNPCGYCPED